MLSLAPTEILSSFIPTAIPTVLPTSISSLDTSSTPTLSLPSSSPSSSTPTSNPSFVPSSSPSSVPSCSPTYYPSSTPTSNPSLKPTLVPTIMPSYSTLKFKNITTFAGTGINGYSGDNGLAINAKINFVQGMFSDTIGNLYFADTNNNRIRKINITTNIITIIAGTGGQGYSGDGGFATNAQLYFPPDVVADSTGFFV
jgi:hypothetical protein